LRPSIRKRTAQGGVILFILSAAYSLYWPLQWLYQPIEWLPVVASFLGTFAFLMAAILPVNNEDEWGSMWPLVGYDNAIDALYVRGPWWQRFEELDEIDAENRTRTAMNEWF
jgi:hypothetical protein